MGYIDAILATNPATYWPMDDASGVADDKSANNLDGTWSGTPGYRGGEVLPGELGVTLSGDDYVTRAPNAAYNVTTGGFCFQLWTISSQATGSYIEFMGRDADVNLGAFVLLDSATGAARGYAGGGSIVGTTRITDGKLHHVVYNRYAGTRYVIVDGVVEASGANSSNVDVGNAYLRIGLIGAVHTTYQGKVGHFSYHTNGFPVDTIKAHYAAGLRNKVFVG